MYLGTDGAQGGPLYLAKQSFYFGINDVVSGDYKTAAPFNSVVFTLYNAWAGLPGEQGDERSVVEARQAVARGQLLFNTKSIQIKHVKGLNAAPTAPLLPATSPTPHHP